MEKHLKNLNRDLDEILLKNITVSSDQKNKILQGIHGNKRKNPVAYYTALVAVAALICLFTLSQLDILKKDPGLSDKNPPAVVPEEEPAVVPEADGETQNPEKMDEETTEKVADEDVPALVDNLMENIIQTFHELGEEYDWDTHHGKLADFEILRPELREYASTNLTEGHLKDIKDNFYIGRDSTFLPSRGFDIRYTVLENTSNRIVISTIGLTGYIGDPETVYYTIIKEDGRWILDDWERVGVDQELLNVTFDEFKIYIDSWGNKLDFLHEVSHEGEKIYVFKASDYHQVEAVYASTSIFVPNDKILDEWIPEAYRKSETP